MLNALLCHSEECSDEESLMSALIFVYAGSNSLRAVGILRYAQNDRTVQDHVDHYRFFLYPWNPCSSVSHTAVILLRQHTLGQGLQTIHVIQIKPLQHDAL